MSDDDKPALYTRFKATRDLITNTAGPTADPLKATALAVVVAALLEIADAVRELKPRALTMGEIEVRAKDSRP